ncbi:hypothetical protein PM082_009899 [Marasmius tenuissimus]|nr:hypothetical protein PM082_009899 [Marasmius tenuissimus]
MYESDRQENRNHSSPGAGGLRLSTPPLGTGSTANGTAVIDPALEGETGGSGARSGEAVPPKLRRSPAPPQAAVRRAKENDYSPVEEHPNLSSNSADRSTIQHRSMPNSNSSKRSASPATSDDESRRPGSRNEESRGHNGAHHESSYHYPPMHPGHPQYHHGHAPLPHITHHGHYYSHPPPPPPPGLHGYSYYPPPPPPGHILPYPGHPHQLPPPHSYPHSHQLPHAQSPTSPHSPHSHPLPPHNQLPGHGPLSSHSPRETYGPGGYVSGAQSSGYSQPGGNVYPSGGGSPGSGEITYTEDAATKLSDRVRRRCFNCGTIDTSTWRRSNLNPGKVLCNKCGLFERTHSRPRPEQFPHKRGPLTGTMSQDRGSPLSPNSNAYPQSSPLVPSQGQSHIANSLPYPLQTNAAHHLPSSGHPSPLSHSSHSPTNPHTPHSPHLQGPASNHTSLPPSGSLVSPTGSSPHSPHPPHHLPSFAPHMTLPPPRGPIVSSSGTHLPPINTAYGGDEGRSSRLPHIQTMEAWHANGDGAHPRANGRVQTPVEGGDEKKGAAKRKRAKGVPNDQDEDGREGKRERTDPGLDVVNGHGSLKGIVISRDEDAEEEEDERAAAAAVVLRGEITDEDEK